MSSQRASELPDPSEVDILINQAEKRLHAARHLFDEGFYDDSVSRAYYSMYFSASAIFQVMGITIKTHKGLVARFGLDFVNNGIIERSYGRALRIAEELRSEADYSISRNISKDEAENALLDAEMFLDRIKRAIEEMDQ